MMAVAAKARRVQRSALAVAADPITSPHTVEWNWRSAGRWPIDSMVMPARTHSLQPGGRVGGVDEPWQRPTACLLPTLPLPIHSACGRAGAASPVQLLLAVGADCGGALIQDGVARGVEQLERVWVWRRRHTEA